MRIPDMDTIGARADEFCCRLFLRGRLRITPMEGSGEFDPVEATRTTNLILRELRSPYSRKTIKINGKQ